MKLKLNGFTLTLFVSLFLFFFGTVSGVIAQQKMVLDEKVVTAVVSMEVAADAFTYSPMGRRDPFKPLIQKKQETVKKIKGRTDKVKGPLEKFELSQYRLIAIMVVKGIPRAMIEAPDGKSYTVKVGQYIGLNDGIVKNIETKIAGIDDSGLRVDKSPDRIVVEEVGIDSSTGNEVKENRYIIM